MNILVVGSVALDSVETPFSKAERVLGGAAVYFGMSARFFCPIRMVGVIGDDFPKKHLATLRKAGIDINGVEQKEGKTFFWQGRYHLNMNHRDTLKTELGVFADFKPKIPKEWKNSPFVFLANIDPELQLDVLNQVRKPRLVACDTMDFWIKGKPRELSKLLKKVDILVINEEETRMLGDKPSLLKSAQAVRKMGPKCLIVKQGEYGALLFTEAGVFASPALLLEKVVDPTGAGDSFAGGFMGILAASPVVDDNTFRQAVIMGSVMASFTVQDFSIRRLAKVTAYDIEKRYNQFVELTRFPEWNPAVIGLKGKR